MIGGLGLVSRATLPAASMLVVNAMKPREPSDNIGATYATYTFNDGVFLILFFFLTFRESGHLRGVFFLMD
jgi:hypothetical protein